MPSESGERRPGRAQNAVGLHQLPPKQTEPLTCPRCDSINTKFCYYNNYNLAQPRHFCKACRRYWTHGGALRNVPVGGGTRKSSKRSRSSSSTTTTNSCLSTSTHETDSMPPSVKAPTPVSVLPLGKVEGPEEELNLNVGMGGTVSTEGENLRSMLQLQSQEQGMMGPYLNDMGIGFGGRGVWAYPGGMMSYVGCGNGGAGGGDFGWQVGDVEGGSEVGPFVGDYGFAWPDLAISSHGYPSK